MNKEKYQIFKHGTFEWTIDSFEKIVNRLKIEPYEYNIDVKEKFFYIPKLGIRYSSGHVYIYPFEETVLENNE